ncbi:MAG: hypothetical protein E7675_04505 [Ruminococcaceae bacterium]|nr:hypothetical protein [Oscillospiraceae bacterium]
MPSKLPKLPLLTVCIFFAVFTFLLFDLDLRAKLTLFLCFVAISVLSVVFAIKLRCKTMLFRVVLVCISAILSLCVIIVSRDLPRIQSEKYYGTHTVEGYISSTHYITEYSSAFFAKITSCDGEKTNFDTYITFDEKISADNYMKFTVDVELSQISDHENLNMTSRAFASRGIFLGGAAVSNIKISEERAGGILSFFGTINEKICNRIDYLLSDDSAGLVCALLFGNKDRLSKTLERDFMTLGITHMLVVSGMNIALIVGEFDLLFKGIVKRKKLRSLLCCLICIFYMLLCQLSLSVVRAAIMQVIYRLTPIFAREYDSKTSLFVSLGIIRAVNPGAIFDIGLLLSFFATLGIIMFSDYTDADVKKLPTLLTGIASSLLASFSACLFVMPVSFAVFECTSVASPIFTLLFSPVLDFLLYLTPIFLVASYIPMVREVGVYICEWVCRGIINFASVGEELSNLYVSLSGKNAVIITLLIVVSIAFTILFKTRKKVLKVIPPFALFFLISIYLLLTSASKGIYYYTNNNNDAILINYQQNSTLIDISTGSKTFTENAKSALISSPLGSTNIDTYVITHCHFDHLVSVDMLASEGYLKNVYMPEPVSDDEVTVYRELIQLTHTYGFSLYTYTAQETPIDVCGISYVFYEPRECSYKGAHKVLLFELGFDNERVVYAGQNIADTDFDDYKVFSEASSVIIGSHYPSIKKPFTYRLFQSSVNLIVSNEEIAKSINANAEKIVPKKDQPLCVSDLS